MVGLRWLAWIRVRSCSRLIFSKRAAWLWFPPLRSRASLSSGRSEVPELEVPAEAPGAYVGRRLLPDLVQHECPGVRQFEAPEPAPVGPARVLTFSAILPRR